MASILQLHTIALSWELPFTNASGVLLLPVPADILWLFQFKTAIESFERKDTAF
jgi:hypothetical protein